MSHLALFFVPLAALTLFIFSQQTEVEKQQRKVALSERFFNQGERALEQEEWAINRKRLITMFVNEMQQSQSLVMFRLNPRPLRDEDKSKKQSFHEYEILQAFSVERAEQRKQLIEFFAATLHWNHYRMASCFNPRLGLRMVSRKRTLEFLVCYECSRVQVFFSVFGDEMEHTTLWLTDPKVNQIDQALFTIESKTP